MAGRDVRVIITAQDDASRSLNAVGSRLRSLRDASDHAGRGLGRIGNLLGDITRQSIGATGPLGRVVEKLIELGIGGGAFVVITAGIVAIVAIYERLTKATREAREETDKLITSLYKASPAGLHEERVKQLKQLNTRIAELQAELDPSRNPFRFALKSAADVDKLREALKKAVYERDRLLTIGAVELPELIAGLPDAATKAAEELRKAREARAERGAEAAAKDLRIEVIPPRIETRDTAAGGATRVAEGELPGTLEEATAGALSFHEALRLITEVTPAVAEGLEAINNSLLGSIPGFGIVAKAAQKAVQIVAKVEGAIAIAKGAVKVAESIWPFNPAGLASGTKMIAEGAKLAALGGGGSGGHSSGGGASGGAAFAQNATATQQQAQRDTVTVIFPPVLPTTDPGVQDWLAEVMRNGQGRNVVFQFGVR